MTVWFCFYCLKVIATNEVQGCYLGFLFMRLFMLTCFIYYYMCNLISLILHLIKFNASWLQFLPLFFPVLDLYQKHEQCLEAWHLLIASEQCLSDALLYSLLRHCHRGNPRCLEGHTKILLECLKFITWHLICHQILNVLTFSLKFKSYNLLVAQSDMVEK